MNAPRAASRTARLVAGYRARATQASHPLCDDPFAAALVGEEGAALCAQFDRLQPEMGLWIVLRTAFIDARIRALAAPDGLRRQVVLLGAGLDARAARLALDGVRYFEVDQPASQADKRARVAAIASYPAAAATYVACDFEHQDFLDGLVDGGFDPTAPAVIVWEGVTPYLSEAAVRATLRRIATGCAPRTTVIFDHVGKRMAEGTAETATRGELDGLGEPLRWGSNDVLPLLFEEGFRQAHVTSFDAIALNLTGTYDRARKWRFQWMAEASVAEAVGWP